MAKYEVTLGVDLLKTLKEAIESIRSLIELDDDWFVGSYRVIDHRGDIVFSSYWEED